MQKQTIIVAVQNAYAAATKMGEDWTGPVDAAISGLGIELLDDVGEFDAEGDTNLLSAIYVDLGDGPKSHVIRLSDDNTWSISPQVRVVETSQPVEFWAHHIGSRPAVVVHHEDDEDGDELWWATYWTGSETRSAGDEPCDSRSDAMAIAREIAASL